MAKSTNDVLGNKTFFAPESRQTCKTFASSSALISVPLIEISPIITRFASVDLPRAIEHNEINVGKASLPVIPMP